MPVPAQAHVFSLCCQVAVHMILLYTELLLIPYNNMDLASEDPLIRF